jgi:hypothetical protein
VNCLGTIVSYLRISTDETVPRRRNNILTDSVLTISSTLSSSTMILEERVMSTLSFDFVSSSILRLGLVSRSSLGTGDGEDSIMMLSFEERVVLTLSFGLMSRSSLGTADGDWVLGCLVLAGEGLASRA